MRAQELMTSPAITCHVNDPLNAVARRMWDDDIGALAVVNDDGELTSMITDRDICMAAFTQGRPLEDMLVNSAMARHVFTAGPTASIDEVANLMAEHHVRRVPIVDREGKPLGVVSLDDLAVESVQPDTPLPQGIARVAFTLAAIGRDISRRKER